MLAASIAHLRRQWMGALALFLVLTGGAAYAVDTVFSSDIVDGEVKSEDIGPNAVNTAKIAANGVATGDVRNDTLSDGGLAATDLRAGSVRSSELSAGAVTSGDLADGAVGASDLAPNPKWHYVGESGEPAFQNGWENYDTVEDPLGATWQHVGFYRDNSGVVHLGGLLHNENLGAIPSTAFTLQEPYCPWFFHPVPVLSENALGRVTVTWIDNSTCQVVVDVGSEDFVSLDGISFRHYSEENSLGPAALERKIQRR